MLKKLKKGVQEVLGFFGIRLSFIVPGQVSEVNRLKWLRDIKIKTVIDVGANKGNASIEFKELFPEAAFYVFEPLPDCFEITKGKLEKFKNVHLYNIALGDEKGTVQMHRSSYSGSSSLLQMAGLHKRLFPVTAGEKLVSVNTDTLDRVMSLEKLQEPILLKIDVQGFEQKVLAGALETLRKVKVVIIETSFCELYIGQPLFGDIYALLIAQGFVYKGTWDPDFRSPEDGSSIQQDAIFIRG